MSSVQTVGVFMSSESRPWGSSCPQSPDRGGLHVLRVQTMGVFMSSESRPWGSSCPQSRPCVHVDSRHTGLLFRSHHVVIPGTLGVLRLLCCRVPVHIRLLDVNDNAPTFTAAYETFVCERTEAGQVRRTGGILCVSKETYNASDGITWLYN